MPTRPDATAVDAAAARVAEHTFNHQVEVVFPVIDDIITDQDLREARSVCLDLGIPCVLGNCLALPKIMLRGVLVMIAPPESCPPGYRPNASAGTPAWMNAETIRRASRALANPA